MRKIVVFVGCGVLLALVALAWWFGYHRPQSQPQPQPVLTVKPRPAAPSLANPELAGMARLFYATTSDCQSYNDFLETAARRIFLRLDRVVTAIKNAFMSGSASGEQTQQRLNAVLKAALVQMSAGIASAIERCPKGSSWTAPRGPSVRLPEPAALAMLIRMGMGYVTR